MCKTTLDDLKSVIAERMPLLLNKIGFEERSAITAQLDWPRIKTFSAADRSPKAEENLCDLDGVLRARGMSLDLIGELNQEDPLCARTALKCALQLVISDWFEKELWIDFTAFRREELLMLISILREECSQSQLERIFGLYVSARQMADWLSGDVVDIRSVVGYAGEISPARQTTLILLMGFEINRARSLIHAYEPAKVIIGMPALDGSINENLFKRNAEVFEKVTEDFSPIITERFEFSARDAQKAVYEIQAIVDKCVGENVVLAPLHTKISTISAGIVAQQDSAIQVCYAAVEDYNESMYSSPGDDVYVVPFSLINRVETG